jgi:hypothetical protein
MRIRANKLIYLPIGGALGVGLLVSAFVRPQPQLAASQACYGVCPSDAALSLSRSTVIDGKESLEQFRVKVSAAAHGAGEPTGSVEVKAGTKLLCSFNLSHGKGRCSLDDRELAPGSYKIVADYSGDANLSPSTSNREHLEVRKR